MKKSEVLNSLAALLMLASLSLSSSAQAETEFAPDSSSIWERDTLSGDWGGARTQLQEVGISSKAWLTGFYQGGLSMDGNDEFAMSGRADLMVNADLEKLGLWQGGRLHTHFTYRGGELSAFRGGALWPVHASALLPLGSKNELVATSLYISQKVGDSTRLMLGKINAVDLLAGHPFFGGWGTDRFWNVVFVAPPSWVVPPVLIGGVMVHSMEPYTLTLKVFDPNDQTKNYSFNHLFADGVNASVGLFRNGELAGRKSGMGITATYSSSAKIDFSQISLPLNTSTITKKGSYNIALDASHLLIPSALNVNQGLGVYAKVAIADGNPNLIRSSVVSGVVGQGMLDGRPHDTFGLGYFWYNLSDKLQNAIKPLKQFDDEQGVEAYYQWSMTPWLKITADVQWVNPATAANKSMWLAGLRTKIDF